MFLSFGYIAYFNPCFPIYLENSKTGIGVNRSYKFLQTSEPLRPFLYGDIKVLTEIKRCWV